MPHDVVNQPPPRTDLDEYATNTALVEGVERHDAAWAHHRLHLTGQRVGAASFQRDAERANRHEPVLRTHDRYGHRVDEVEYDDAYHRIIGAALADGAHTGAYVEPMPGANVTRATAFMLYAQVEPGHACPVSMTHAAVPVLQHGQTGWLGRTFSTTYDPALSAGKRSALFGMAMTEKQGGSDVRSNTTTATPTDDGAYLLDGHKWFCSAPMSDAFLVLARRPADGPVRRSVRLWRILEAVHARTSLHSLEASMMQHPGACTRAQGPVRPCPIRALRGHHVP